MNKEYLLIGYNFNEKIFYSLKIRKLSVIDGASGAHINLRRTMSELLEYLLLHGQKRKVSDEELMVEIWDKRHLKSSSQRIWQVVKDLKNILHHLGLDDELILRVNGNGYILDKNLIKPLYTTND